MYEDFDCDSLELMLQFMYQYYVYVFVKMWYTVHLLIKQCKFLNIQFE